MLPRMFSGLKMYGTVGGSSVLQRHISRTTDNTLYNRIRVNRHNNKRALSTIQNKVDSPTSRHKLLTDDESREFMAVFHDIVKDLTDVSQIGVPELSKRFEQVLHYNTPNGKMYRGHSVVALYKLLEKPGNLTPENIRLANIMGWCAELLQACEVIIDDVVDKSKTRRGSPCWYLDGKGGMNAINDSNMVRGGVDFLLKRYFSKHRCYLPTLEIFHDVALKTSMGQVLDGLSAKEGKPNFDLFTMNIYNRIVKYKLSGVFYLPVALAMSLVNMYDIDGNRQAISVLMEMALLYQIRDDFMDCFGDPDRSDERGTDIQEGKCSWLAVVALQKASPAQKKIMDEYYGKSDPEAVKIIKRLYEDLDLPTIYKNYDNESFSSIHTHIQQNLNDIPKDLFFKLAEGNFARNFLQLASVK